MELKNVERFARYAEIEKKEARCEEYHVEDADIIVVGFGIAARVAKSAVDAARAQGIRVGLIRPITLWPFPKEALYRAATHAKRFISVELSMGQMVEDISLAIHCKAPVDLCFRTGGMIPSPEQVLNSITDAKTKIDTERTPC